jgi:hypothetical protein
MVDPKDFMRVLAFYRPEFGPDAPATETSGSKRNH